ncbi:MAG: ATP synthase F1 subunit delta [Bdellovibrionaceae bacterium]|nr:ATP synthase F1 subunit delta [Pseudobdellovibrionaceae bacterium]
MNKRKSEVYARALFELDSGSEFLKNLNFFSNIFIEKKSFSFFLSLGIPLSEKKKFLIESLKKAPSLLKNFFLVLLDNKGFSFLPEIVKIYQDLLDDKNKICRGLIFSPQKPSQKEKEQIEKLLGKFFNKTVVLEAKEDKKLIAGFLVSAGGYMFKGTSAQYLRNFEKLGGL